MQNLALLSKFLLVFQLFLGVDLVQAVNITRIPSMNAPPPERQYHFMDYNSKTNQLLIFGGSQGITTTFNDIWLYDFATSQYHNLVPTNEIAPGIV